MNNHNTSSSLPIPGAHPLADDQSTKLKNNDVKVRQNTAEATRERPGESHDQIPDIVRVASNTPPSRDDQFHPMLCSQCPQTTETLNT